MKILVLSEVGSTGEWVATERLLAAAKRVNPRAQFFLTGFSTSNRQPHKTFTKTTLLPLLSPGPPLSFFKQIIGDLVRSRRAVKQLLFQAGPSDYIIVTHYLLALAIWNLRQLRNRPVIYYFHGLRSLDALKLARSTLKQRILYSLERLALKQSTAIMVPSASGATLVRRLLGASAGKPKIFVVPHFLPSVFFSPVTPRQTRILQEKLRLKDKEKIILYCGRVATRKGLENLMISFASLARRRPKLKLVMATPAENMDQGLYNFLQQMIKYFNITGSVKWIWDLTPSERAGLYQLSLVAVLPSEFEVSSLFFLEALASGTPVIATRVGGMERILAKIDSKLVLTNNKPETIASAIKQILAFPSGRITKLRSACQDQARIYGESLGVRRFLQVLTRVSGSRL